MHMTAQRASRWTFLGASALLFAVSTAATVVWCGSMPAAGSMPMPGGRASVVAWMPMPGQDWPAAGASFLGMWTVMMAAMMLPSLVPMLERYREAAGGVGEMRLGALTALVGSGYFLVWISLGMAAFPLGAGLSAAKMQLPELARALPPAAGVLVVIAGALQFTAWKARRLACCRRGPRPGGAAPASAGSALRHGLRLGLDCCICCAGLTVVLLSSGVMDLRVMVAVTAAITAERLGRDGERIARVTGALIIGAGLLQTVHATGLV